MYDKRAQKGLATPLTRIEYRLKDKKFPFRSVAEVFEKLEARLQRSACLNKVRFLNIKAKPNQSKRSQEKYRIYIHEVLKHGYYHHRKTENEHGNFSRNVKRFFIIEQSDFSIKEAFIKKAKEQLLESPIKPHSKKEEISGN